MQSTVLKRSVVVARRKTSVSLEDEFWIGLKEIAARRHTYVAELIGQVNETRGQGNLSSALRLFILEYYREQVETAAPKIAA